jgi:hypothetical protein
VFCYVLLRFQILVASTGGGPHDPTGHSEASAISAQVDDSRQVTEHVLVVRLDKILVLG